jgi:ParB family chromosome partitioning protein
MELTTEMLANTATIRENSTRGEDIVKIALDKIVVRDGFNVREDYGDIEGLAYSMIENGQLVPGRVDALADGTFCLTDGHRRFKAMQKLADLGHEPLFKAIINAKKTTEEQRILQMFATQDNKPLLPNEVAELINRLINLGYKQTDVAKKLGKTGAYVSQMLSYVTESPLIKDEVKGGNISVAAVLDLQKLIPNKDERVKAVKSAVEKKKAAADAKKKADAAKGKDAKSKDAAKGKDADKISPLSANEVVGKKDKGAIALELCYLIEELYKEELEGADLKPLVSLLKTYL